ncbi:MAG TPA: hypothetical protein PLZ52_05250 [Bacteroidales bacterium]|nr:hypothetical protein [Bacteroidales bacterium]HQL70159.1 hypothetical protein [Bacteroidales bacterium]
MKVVRAILLLAIGTTLCSSLFSQTMIQPKLGIVGLHPFSEPNRHLFENKIDAEAWFVTEPLFMVSIETLLREDTFSWRIMPGFYSDAVSKPALFLNLSLKLKLIQSWRNSIYISAGGSILGRQKWNTIPGYVEQGGFTENGTWEYRLGPFAELEYGFFINDNSDFTISAMFGHQHNTFTFTVGYRYWLSTVIKHPAKCGSCPFIKSDNKYKKF